MTSLSVRVPVSSGSVARWGTFATERTLVVAVRTVTSAIRVLEVLPDLVGDDPRVRVVFAVDDTSAFSAGVLETLHAHGCQGVSWQQFDTLQADLVLTASENVDVPGTCPVLVIPHGVGFHKWVPDSRSTGIRLSGVVPEPMLQRSRMVISHPDQRAQLDASVASAAVETGDVCYERLLASRVQRDVYRQALGMGASQRLIVLSSTWGTSSLLAGAPHLPARLLSELPLDEYRVALIAHPNVWSYHGTWQLRSMQRAALAAGLVVVPASRGWQAAVVAADAVIGDHGSVTFYSACLDRPTAVAAFGNEAVPGTSSALFGEQVPRLNLREGLRSQVEEVMASHRPGRWNALVERTFAEPARATVRLRSLLYEMLRLPEPAMPVRLQAFPPPVRERRLPVASVVTIRAGQDRGSVSLERFPAAVTRSPSAESDSLRFLVCDRDEADTGLLLSASAVLVQEVLKAEDAAEAARLTLEQCPGALFAVARLAAAASLVRLSDGHCVTVRADGPHDLHVAAAVVYWCLRTCGAVGDAEFAVDVAQGVRLAVTLSSAVAGGLDAPLPG